MTMTSAPAFTGFSRDAIQFLVELAEHNDRAWFQPRKADYERLLKRPLEALCVALADRFAERGIPLHADPVRSPFRIYRDVRFSKDKSPYKTHVSAAFRWTGERGTADPGGYFHLGPGEAFVGGGVWHPERAWVAAWREAVDRGEGLEALDDPAFRATFGEVGGERLARVPPGFPKDHPRAELLRHKDVTFGRRLSDEEVLSPELPDVVARDLAVAVPVMRLLAGIGR